ncbi:hypothetical protein GGX14DRAFT_572947 [Mycena pura]|uniref:Uncharacterized protein n=1 Tax=Mycena pura TaxID=153505 RepID=A0AAD6V0R3_9AGAR|nr:hypothetical protein GGX14DRAFT_572947 [Mycena pura]
MVERDAMRRRAWEISVIATAACVKAAPAIVALSSRWGAACTPHARVARRGRRTDGDSPLLPRALRAARSDAPGAGDAQTGARPLSMHTGAHLGMQAARDFEVYLRLLMKGD